MAGAVEQRKNFFDTKVLGHPAGLFVLFFTEMWERFSFYGMRVLLINFLTMAIMRYNPGWEWSAENASSLFGTYVLLLYITPILGGMLADKLLGYRWAVIVGAIIMTLGHAAMALETEMSLYLGLGLLVIGTGFFKPNITSIISEMYKDLPEKKDGAYTIFYMGVNAGAFFGMMLCGYLAEKIGWSWGFGLAGVFMLFGTLQFWLSKPLFGNIGDSTKKKNKDKLKAIETAEEEEEVDTVPRNPFTLVDKVLVVISVIAGLIYAFNDLFVQILDFDMVPFEVEGVGGRYVTALIGVLVFIYLSVSRILRYERVTRDRMIAFIVFAFFTVFFWLSFEQGASSLIIFARDSVDRVMTGDSATLFNIFNALLTIIPLVIISWVLVLLWRRTYKSIPSSNIVLVLCFAGMWTVVGWMLNREMNASSYIVSYQAYATDPIIDEETKKQKLDENGEPLFKMEAVTENGFVPEGKVVETIETSVIAYKPLEDGSNIQIIAKDNDRTQFAYVKEDRIDYYREIGVENNVESGLVNAQVIRDNGNQIEITVSWFSILNSFFIIAFASLISKWWDSKYNPSAAGKYALGLIIMAIGFGLLALGAYGLEEGAKVSMVWLILAYLFHTIGELCLSPVGLSYVSKLVPARMIAFMFGMWYVAIAIGNNLAAILGGEIENITEKYSLSTFFLIFTIVPVVAGVLIYLLNPWLKKLMHGVR